MQLETFLIRAAEIVRGRSIPAAQVPGNHAWIDFAGPPRTYRTYSMADALAARVPSSAFTGKVVLVGVTAPIAKDVFVTSASAMPMSGVEVQANSIETALQGFPLRSANLILSLAVIIAVAMAPVLMGFRLNSLLVGLLSSRSPPCSLPRPNPPSPTGSCCRYPIQSSAWVSPRAGSSP